MAILNGRLSETFMKTQNCFRTNTEIRGIKSEKNIESIIREIEGLVKRISKKIENNSKEG